MAAKKTKKKVKLKKLKVVQLWSVSKTLAKKNLMAHVKKAAKETRSLYDDDPAGLKEKLAELKEVTKNYAALVKSFNSGLTKKLKATEKAKDADAMLNGSKEALVIVKDYRKKLSRYAGKIGPPKQTSLLLGGALGKLKKELDATVKYIEKAQG